MVLSRKTIVVSAFLLWCGSTQLMAQAFKVVGATQKHIRSGIAGGKSYTDYTFKLQVLTNQSLQFDSVRLAGVVYPLMVAHKAGSTTPQPIKQNDIITVKTQVEDGANTATPSVEKPTANAVISYHLGNARRTFTVKRIKVLPAQESN